MKDINFGTFPTMITPYHDDNTVDYEAVKNITNWYIENGCTGIFADAKAFTSCGCGEPS